MARKTTKAPKTETTETTEQPVKEKKVRPAISDENCQIEVDDEGAFTSVPQPNDGEEEVDLLHFQPLKKEQFADEATFLEYRAEVADARVSRMSAKAAKLREQAELSRKFGDTKMRKKAKSLLAKREQIAALEAELKAAGIEL